MPDDVYDGEFDLMPAQPSRQLAHRETTGDIAEQIGVMKARAEMLTAVRNLALAQLAGNPHLMTAYPGANESQNFRLTKHGAARVARLCGIQKDAAEWDESQTGEYMEGDVRRYHATCNVRVSFPGGGSAEEIGSADSSQGLFKGAPLTPVIKENIRKHAHANGFVRAVESLLGMGGLTAEDLMKAGCRPDDVPSVEFRKGGRTADQASRATAAATSGMDDDGLRAKARELLSAREVESISDVDAIMAAISSFPDKNNPGQEVAGRPLAQLNGKRLEIAVKNVGVLCGMAEKEGVFGVDQVLALVSRAKAAGKNG